MFSIAEQFISSPSCLESDLHYSVRSPARRCPSANAWDVLRVENLVLEGFSNVFRKEVSARFRSFAFSAPCCNASATFWIGNNNSGTSSLYGGTGNAINIFTEAGGVPGNFVIVPPPGFAPGTQSTPTGVVFNGSSTDFLLDKGTPAGLPAAFIFATEDGTISGWNPGANLAAGATPPSINAVLEVDNSEKGGPNGAVYKGATSGEINGHKFLYVTNFRAARIEVYHTTFKRVNLGEDAFNAEEIPHGFAPFNIQNIGGTLFVTYAKQDAARHDDVAGDGLGFVELFTPAGKHIGHL